MAIYLSDNEIKDIYLGSQEVKEVYLGNKKVWSKEQPTPAWEGLKFTATQDNSAILYKIQGSLPDIDINYSLDNGATWTAWDGTAITLNNGESICVWNKSETLSKDISNFFQLWSSNKLSASGNCNSLLNFGNLSDYCFYKLFGFRTDTGLANGLIAAPDLPATTLAPNCYQQMFNKCVNLVEAPELPATELSANCYHSMFSNCSNLTSVPNLPATTLAANCYQSMFSQCTSITEAPVLPATTLVGYCYYDMFNGCTNLTTAPDLPATTLANYCYGRMFYNCTNLTTAPDLPATTLKSNCYSYMFYGCSLLNSIKTYYRFEFSSSYSNQWVKGVSSTGTFYYNGYGTATGVSAIPTGWTVQTF